MNPARLPWPHASVSGSESKAKGGACGSIPIPIAIPIPIKPATCSRWLGAVWGRILTLPLMERGGDVLVAVP